MHIIKYILQIQITDDDISCNNSVLQGTLNTNNSVYKSIGPTNQHSESSLGLGPTTALYRAFKCNISCRRPSLYVKFSGDNANMTSLLGLSINFTDHINAVGNAIVSVPRYLSVRPFVCMWVDVDHSSQGIEGQGRRSSSWVRLMRYRTDLNRGQFFPV